MDPQPSLRAALLSRKTAWSFVALIAASALFLPANALIHARFPDRPIVPDLFFSLVPPVPWLAFATDPLLVGSVALLLWHALGADRRRLPWYIAAAAAIYFARAPLMILTPLGRPTGNLDHYGLLRYLGFLQHGMFPSGHQMLSTYCWLAIGKADSPRLRRAAGVLCALEALTLLLSRGHYSIDVVGGVLAAWFVVERMCRYRDRLAIGV